LVNDSNCPACVETSQRHRHPHSDAKRSATASSTSGHGRRRAPRAADGLRRRASCGLYLTRRMAFGYGTSVPTRGPGAVIASSYGFGRVEGRVPKPSGGHGRRRAAVQRGGIVVTTGARADYVGELRIPGIADHV
jgi:hypothetical protein